jgi:hypothetical protein
VGMTLGVGYFLVSGCTRPVGCEAVCTPSVASDMGEGIDGCNIDC